MTQYASTVISSYKIAIEQLNIFHISCLYNTLNLLDMHKKAFQLLPAKNITKYQFCA